jgi:chromate transporter
MQSDDVSTNRAGVPEQTPLRQVIALFLRLGFTAFGGPAAHIGMFHDEAVKKRKWLTDQEFLDLLGITNLIPGPNSTEMAIHIGYRQAGLRGLLAAGVCFVLPAMLIVLGFAWAYVNYGETPQVNQVLYGIKPVMIAIIVQAIWLLGRKAVTDLPTLLVGAGVLALYFLGVNEILLLFSGGLVIYLVRMAQAGRLKGLPAWFPPLGVLGAGAFQAVSFQLSILFLTFLKIGFVLYGSGYVLLAFLRADFVERLGWLTDQQLIDAIAIGQVTPGPLFTSATFIGYLLDGVPGALLATAGIFLPSFVLVLLIHPFIPRLRRAAWTGYLLDGVNVSSLGLMAAVTWQLGLTTIIDPWTAAIAMVSGVLLLRYRLNTTWLVLGGAVAGLLWGGW